MLIRERRDRIVLSKVLEEAINQQINKELYSAYLYLSMSAYCETADLPGFAHWMRMQAQEEVIHAMKFFEYVNDRGSRILLQAIDQPPTEWESALAVFQHVLEHEQMVTGLINQLYALAIKENDYASQMELQWFVTEQVEEEKNAGHIVGQLEMIADQTMALLMLDRQMATRLPPQPPVAEEAAG
jgi:ferritin